MTTRGTSRAAADSFNSQPVLRETKRVAPARFCIFHGSSYLLVVPVPSFILRDRWPAHMTESPSIAEDVPGRQFACHYASGLDLPGIGQLAAVGAAQCPDEVLPEGSN